MNRKLLLVIAALAVFAGSAFAQGGPQIPAGRPVQSLSVGIFDSVNYKYWGMFIAAGNTATGAQTITVCPSFQVLPDGRVFQPLAPSNGVFVPVTIDATSSSAVETVTPTAYSLVNAPAGVGGLSNGGTNQCANITATFANTHGASMNGFQVISGDQGIQEAINDASLGNGGSGAGGMVHWVIDPGIVTLNTGGQTTNVGSINIPTKSIVTVATARVTTTITTCAGGWSLGRAGGTGTDFTAANTTLTAGTTTDTAAVNINTPVVMQAAASLPTIFCTTSAAGAGAVHPHYEGWKLVAPGQ